MTVHRTQISIQYKGFTIETDNEFHFNGFLYYLTAQGKDHDCDMDSDGYHYCGNVKWASTIEEAKDAIMEKIMQEKPAYLVKTYSSEHKLHFNLTKFWWIEEALSFADKFNGTPLFPINSI